MSQITNDILETSVKYHQNLFLFSLRYFKLNSKYTIEFQK